MTCDALVMKRARTRREEGLPPLSGDEMSVNEGGGVASLPDNETSMNEEGGGVAPLPGDETYVNEGGGVASLSGDEMSVDEEGGGVLVTKQAWTRREEGLPPSLVTKRAWTRREEGLPPPW